MTHPDPTARPLRWVRTAVLGSIVGSLVGAAFVGVMSALLGEFGTLSWRAIGTIALFVVFSLLSWYDADVSARRSRWFGVISVAASIYLLVVGVVKIWLPVGGTEPAGLAGGTALTDYADGFADLVSWVSAAVIARIALLHIHLLLLMLPRVPTRAMRIISRGTFALVAVLAVMLSLPVLTTGRDYPELYWRILAAVAIADALGTILVPLIPALFHRKPKSKPAPQVLMWPRYADGRPLPVLPDGTPDFTGVRGSE